jgi:putative transposase
MSMQKRKFTKEQKLEILEEASLQGVQATMDKHGLYPTTFYSWKKKFETMGEAGFRHGMTPEHIKEIKRLEKENEQLKLLLAEKELEGRLKDELLKKKYAWARNGK